MNLIFKETLLLPRNSQEKFRAFGKRLINFLSFGAELEKKFFIKFNNYLTVIKMRLPLKLTDENRSPGTGQGLKIQRCPCDEMSVQF